MRRQSKAGAASPFFGFLAVSGWFRAMADGPIPAPQRLNTNTNTNNLRRLGAMIFRAPAKCSCQ
jgi:hypothetical protein